MAVSSRWRGRAAAGRLSCVRSRQPRAAVPSRCALSVRTQILSAAVRGALLVFRPSGTQKAAPRVAATPLGAIPNCSPAPPVSGVAAPGWRPVTRRAAPRLPRRLLGSAATRGPPRAANLAVTSTARAGPARGPARRGADPQGAGAGPARGRGAMEERWRGSCSRGPMALERAGVAGRRPFPTLPLPPGRLAPDAQIPELQLRLLVCTQGPPDLGELGSPSLL